MNTKDYLAQSEKKSRTKNFIVNAPLTNEISYPPPLDNPTAQDKSPRTNRPTPLNDNTFFFKKNYKPQKTINQVFFLQINRT